MRHMSLFSGRGSRQVATAVAGLLFASAASALPVGELIQNGGFQSGAGPTIDSWATTGTVNARVASDTINKTGGNAGFNDFFTSRFAVLGDAQNNIGLGPQDGISSVSQSFTLSAIFNGISVGSYDLSISLDSVFDGDDSAGPTNAKDSFYATLTGGALNLPLFFQSSDPLPDCGPAVGCADNQIVHNPFITAIYGVLPGVYTLTIALDEASGGNVNATNTAAGIDNVSVQGWGNPRPVVALSSVVPEPAVVLLSGLGLALLGVARRRIA